MDDARLEFWADIFVAERIQQKTGETLLQFIERKEKEWKKEVTRKYGTTRSVEIYRPAKS